ncbi:hypothetical protein BDN72DRAFT_843647 [Pluteus cervinus]|uniref:Uncharacterized protein n=1 Tax=Pluteus cervinus TaxID=181527 RepID=A0ACD3AN04_9AGAR|nr:hypothetical protein BDN72DRAFT_843647 [Pluteus cervinus]
MTTAADLPFELIQEILTFSAWSSLKQASVLARVSSHIYDLIKPILFRTFIYWNDKISWPGLHAASNPEWLELNGKHARNVLLGDEASNLDLTTIISSCPNITDLAIWLDGISDKNLPSLLTLRPHRLSIYLDDFFRGPFQEAHAKLPMFINLTHLDLAGLDRHDLEISWNSIEGVRYVPKLTHLSLSRSMDSISDASAIQNSLQHCEHLAVLVLWLESEILTKELVNEIPFPSTIHEEISGDPRVVSLESASFEQWELGSQGGKDIWAVADEIVERRMGPWRREWS